MSQIDLSRYAPPKRKSTGSKANVYNLMQMFNQEISFAGAQLPDKKKEMLYGELHTLIKSGIDIKTALDMSGASFDKQHDKKLILQISELVIAGNPLSFALESMGKFSSYEYFSIRIGEETGRSAEVLEDLHLYFKRKISQRRKIISAVTYPIIVLCTSFGAIFFMIKFVVPMFGDVFSRFGGKLPYLTQTIITISESFDRYFFLLILLPIVSAFFHFTQRRKEFYKKHTAQLILATPLVGDIVRKIYLARFANTMRLLVGTDTPLLQALSLVREMIGFHPVQKSIQDAERDIMNGKTLSQSLEKNNFYPIKFVQMIRIAEEINQLEHFFGQLSNQYTEEVEFKTNTIGNLLEPIIIIVLGAVVGTILIAMYLPMFQLSNSF
ncbi:MAG: type II secretion system F family protein [Sphingobacteriales bacterium]|nr:MAG: type II secretion system F family protein [Sphingobacteriales bacterium]